MGVHARSVCTCVKSQVQCSRTFRLYMCQKSSAVAGHLPRVHSQGRTRRHTRTQDRGVITGEVLFSTPTSNRNGAALATHCLLAFNLEATAAPTIFSSKMHRNRIQGAGRSFRQGLAIPVQIQCELDNAHVDARSCWKLQCLLGRDGTAR